MNLLPEYVRVPVHDKAGNSQLIHIANRKRIDQTRGVPYLATVTPLLKQLSRFAEGETAAAVLNSFIAFVTKTRDGSSPLGDSGVVGSGRKRQLPQKISPNMNIHLREGESVDMLDPKRPNSNFSSFFDAIVKLIGAELEIPFEVLISSFNSSYSASRAAMVKAFQVYKLRRKWLVENFHRQVWDWFIEDCILNGHLTAPGFFEDPIKRLAYTSCEWIGDSPLQLDPVKEANGAGKLHELGVISKKTLTQLLTGQNYENVVEQRKKERILEDELIYKTGA
jgi:lambda family phage portal protein